MRYLLLFLLFSCATPSPREIRQENFKTCIKEMIKADLTDSNAFEICKYLYEKKVTEITK